MINRREEEFIKGAINFKTKKAIIIFLFFATMLIPFVFTIINFSSLKTCENNPSNGCPSLYVANPDGSSGQNYIDPGLNKLIQENK